MARALAEPPVAHVPSAQSGDLRARVFSSVILAPLALLCLWAGDWPWIALLSLTAVGLIAEWLLLCRRRPGVSLAAAGVGYILMAVAALAWLRADGWGNVLFVLLIVWATDIGAYMVGRRVGGARLAPRISPGKTWSGAVGGLACAVGVGLGSALLAPGASGRALAVAAGLSVAAQAGDLLESGMKRHFGVKDSGRLIPGHGGLLDRLDGLLAAAPVAALLAAAFGRGVALWR